MRIVTGWSIVTGLMMATGFGSAVLLGQSPSPPYADLKRVYDSARDNLRRLAEQMPEADYAFQPTPEMRTFGELVAHIANVQADFCSAAQGVPKPASANSKASKADLVAALNHSSDLCDAAFDWLTPATASLPGGGPIKVTKLGMLVYVTGHSNEEYGYASVYLRLKGIVPPSSMPR